MILRTTPIKMEGVAAVISDKIVPVGEYCVELASPKKLRKLISATGFESLSIAAPDVCCSDMCVQAAEHLFEAGGFSREEIGALIFVTQSPDYHKPSTAYILQSRLGLSNELLAFDVNLGCSGFVYGLYVASSLLSNLDMKVLICCGDVENNRHAPPNNLSTAALFGDVGACAIISRRESDESMLFNIQSYGERWHDFYSEDGGQRRIKNLAAGKLDTSDSLAHMDGMSIMDFGTHEVVENINKLLNVADIERNSLGAYLFHQPNKSLVDDIAAMLKLDNNLVIANAQRIGNTHSASIPLLLTELGSEWSTRPNKRALMSGFGGGLSVASTIMDLDDLICLETKHYERR